MPLQLQKKPIVLGLVMIAIIIGISWAAFSDTPRTPIGHACTQEAKICPDGSSVGRTGPDCRFAPCPEGAAPTPGVRGTVTLGPTCPVERTPPDPLCAPKPYETPIVISPVGSSVPFLIGNSDASGSFQFSLPEGKYTLAAGGTKMLPRCSAVTVTVTASGYATADISCDTGIR